MESESTVSGVLVAVSSLGLPSSPSIIAIASGRGLISFLASRFRREA